MQLTQDAFLYLTMAVFSFVLCFMAWQRRLVIGAFEMSMLMMFIGFWSFLLFCQSVATDLPVKILWSNASYVFVTCSPVLYLVFVFKFLGRQSLVKVKQTLFLYVVPAITIYLVWSNDDHHLMWTGMDPLNQAGDLIHFHRGLWFWLGVIFYSYLMMGIATWTLSRYVYRNRRVLKLRGWLMITAAVFPLVSSVLFITGIGYDSIIKIFPFLVLLSGGLFTIAFYYSGFYNLLPVARELLVEVLPDGILTLDQLNRVQDINKKGIQMLGLSKGQKLGLDLMSVAPEYKKLTEAILSMKKELVVNMDDAGATVYYIIKDSAKSLQGCRLVIIRDITHQRQIEQELVNARNKAEESDRLKSAFLANMSHEIRTPMNTILGFVSLLQESDHDEKEQTEYLQIVRDSSERLLNTLSDIIDLSKVEAGFTTPTYSDFDVQDLFMNLYVMQKKAADDKQLLFIRQWNVPSEFLYIYSDKEKVFSIVTNLVNNAIKYTNQGFVEFRCQVTREQLDITVKDTGIGIPEEMLQSIFERFMQVDTSHQRLYEGAGLGLSITKAYVDMLGGSIDVESELGKGSVFHVSLPISIADVFLHDA